MSFLDKSLQRRKGIRRYIGPKRAVLVCGVAAFALLAWNLYNLGILSPSTIAQYHDSHPVTAVLLFILIYAVSVAASLPSLPLNLAGGFFWGGFVGGVYTVIGATIGSWISFAFARSIIGQPLAEKFDNKWMNKVQHEFDRNGWKFIAFARINPIIPTGPLNYLLGLTSVSVYVFLATTFVFLLPLSIAVAYIGDTLETLTFQQAEVSGFVRSVLIISAVVTLFALTKLASAVLGKPKDKL